MKDLLFKSAAIIAAAFLFGISADSFSKSKYENISNGKGNHKEEIPLCDNGEDNKKPVSMENFLLQGLFRK